MFQSTHPFGCDSRKGVCVMDNKGFNPRTRLGATPSSWVMAA